MESTIAFKVETVRGPAQCLLFISNETFVSDRRLLTFSLC